MPGGFPLGTEFCNAIDIGTNAAASGFTSITGSGTFTVGAYTQLVASTANDTCWMLVQIRRSTSLVTNNSAVDISVGAAASEVVIVNKLSLLNPSAVNRGAAYWFPVKISAGTRVSARVYGGDAVTVGIIMFDGAFTAQEGCAGVDEYGLNGSGVSTAIVCGNNALGSYSQITASTTADYCGLGVYFDGCNQTNASGADMLFTVAIGGAGAEKAIIPNIGAQPIGDQVSYHPGYHFFPVPIPSGTRIAVAASQNGGTVTAGAVIYGVMG